MKAEKQAFFTAQLMIWNAEINRRQMPWKGEKDPYKIWLSEIILQQTRVEQGWEYYNRFIKKFPTIQKLAAAPETTVFKLWEGLGYYSRCKNLIATAKHISKELHGKFPSAYEDILKLKGVGPYTAAAIASFAYNLPYAVVDGNVMRVLSRYFGIDKPIDSAAGKKYFNELAGKLLDKKKPGLYNQAIMDFGATVCKPRQALCSGCPLQGECVAYRNDEVGKYPMKESRLIKKHRWFYYIIAGYQKEIFVRKRTGKDIWQNLYEFILIEKNKQHEPGQLLAEKQITDLLGKDTRSVKVSKIYKQQLTHQTIHGLFIHLELKRKRTLKEYETITAGKIKKLPFPKFITGYLNETGTAL